MSRVSNKAWWYWLVTDVLLAGWLAGCVTCFWLAVLICIVQSIHFAWHRGSITAFPVQVRLAYLALLAIGLWPPLSFVHWIQLVGTSAVVVWDYCFLARSLSLLPWNRSEPLTAGLVLRTFFTRPARHKLFDENVGPASSPECMCSLTSRPSRQANATGICDTLPAGNETAAT